MNKITKVPYDQIERDRPFYIARVIKKGVFDKSKFQIDGEDNILRIWFSEGFWINAPDTRTENKWIRQIEKYGVIYE